MNPTFYFEYLETYGFQDITSDFRTISPRSTRHIEVYRVPWESSVISLEFNDSGYIEIMYATCDEVFGDVTILWDNLGDEPEYSSWVDGEEVKPTTDQLEFMNGLISYMEV